MDPPAIMNDGGFQSASFNLAEIWPFPINGAAAVGGDTGIGLDLRRFGHDLGNVNVNANRDVPGSDPMVLDQRLNQNEAGGGARKRREVDDSVKATDNGVNDSDSKRLKMTGSRDENQESKPETEANSGKPAEQSAKPTEPPKQDYIHVRARRGQATDSHSLAERARREKISERMKILQDLVPGCNKVIGKALVLDEIINYIQSLQRQVEFLSMKLEAVNSRINPSVEGLSSKDFGQQTFDAPGMAFNSQAPREYGRGSSPEWLHMQIGGGFDRTT